MNDEERLELEVLRRACKEFANCSILVKFEQGWVPVLLKNRIQQLGYKAAIGDNRVEDTKQK